MEMVESGKVDLGLIESPTVRPTLRSRQIGKDDLAVAVSPDHPWADGRPVGPGDLASAGLLVREPGSGTGETLDRALAATGHEVTPALELASNTALKSAAIARMGPVVLSAIAIAHEFETRTLVEVNLDGVDLSRPLTVIWIDSTSLSHEAVTLFLNAVGADRRTRGRWPRLYATATEHEPSPGDAATLQVPADPSGRS
jgi:DNA-binding transcriptional LysR family regulator